MANISSTYRNILSTYQEWAIYLILKVIDIFFKKVLKLDYLATNLINSKYNELGVLESRRENFYVIVINFT